MKQIAFLIGLILTTPGLFAQPSTEAENPVAVTGTRSIIWSEDFASGIPSEWVNQEAGGIAYWEYRGPETDPGTETGSIGSCNANGTGPAIQSPTRDNGFILFDSNYWDSPTGLCTAENIGTGPAPGPHLATLTTGPIDFTEVTNAALRFHQYIRYFQGTIRVEVSTENTDWTPIYSPNLPQGFTSPNSQVISIALPSFTQGATSVRFRFVYQGLYYFWQIDDLEIYEIFANDLELQAAYYGTYSLDDPGNFNGLEYSYYPVNMSPLITFQAFAQNIGQNTQTNCRLSVELKNENTGAILYSAESDTETELPLGAGMMLSAGTFQMPQVPGHYRIYYSLLQNEVDGNPQNGLDTLEFFISPTTWARDRIWTHSIYSPTTFSDVPFVAGNIFRTQGTAIPIQSMSIGVGQGSSSEGSVFGAIYEFDIDDFSQINLLASTDTIAVDTDLLNGPGDNLMHTLTFANPPVLNPAFTYLIVAGSPDGAASVKLAMSGVSPDYSSWVIFDEDNIFYLTRMPMVRLNFDPISNIREHALQPSLNLFPNPATTSVKIELPGTAGPINRMTIRDQTGRVVPVTILAKDSRLWQLDVTSLESGIYLVEVEGQFETACSRLVVH